MRIVHIITRLILGGAQENTLITCKVLAQRGHDVTLITGPALGPEGELFEQAKGQGFDVVVVDKLRRAINPVNDTISYIELKKLLRRLQPDIVHTHSAKAGILGRFAARSLCHCEACEAGRGNLSRCVLRLLRRTAPRNDNVGQHMPAVVHTIHGLAFHPYQSPALNKFYIAVEKSAAKRTDFFISVADAMTAQATAAGIGTPEQYVTAYSAIEEDDFLRPVSPEHRAEFRRKYGIAEDAVVLVTVARLFMLKGHEYIIESAKSLAGRFDKCVWLFVGDGDLSEALKRQVRELGLQDRFKFTGLLPPSRIPLAIQSSDMLVHCSLREGLARTLPQAMLCAKPAISFDVDGAREVVNENTGRLIEPKNVGQLIEACAELIEDKSLRERLGENGRVSVTERFSPDRMVDSIEAVYRKLLQQE
ncbi:MAG: glycosyltransferase family 4 protein [Planctomycetota bacterium]